ncbi:MAG: FAD-binding oxidoreductase [Candidatus Aminicenantes bacterium]|nr:FAD-binding oxidoreductase [Candidatus Aminicenantes bacterium]
MKARNFDVIIIGGGVMGSSIAYHLLEDGFDGTVAILEKDPTYEHASTSLSVGGIRQQFSTKVNIEIGLYGIDKIERFDEEMTVDGEPAHAEFRPVGYLFLGDENNWEPLQKQHRLQKTLGVNVELLTPEELQKMIPHLNVGSLLGASFGTRAGYTDPYGILQGYLRKAKSLGANYLHEEVTAILRQGDRMQGVKTARGDRIEANAVVIASGPWAAEVGAMAGIDLPVDPSPKMVFHFDPAEKFDYDLPFFFSPKGHWCRPESGRQFVSGKDREVTPGFRFDWDRSYFEETVWPELTRLIPSFERLKLKRGWGGLYAVNRLDDNALLGTYPGVEGLYVAVGFSGHGLMQSPAVGKGISDLIRTGSYETIDLSPLGADRIMTGRRVIEEAVF